MKIQKLQNFINASESVNETFNSQSMTPDSIAKYLGKSSYHLDDLIEVLTALKTKDFENDQLGTYPNWGTKEEISAPGLVEALMEGTSTGEPIVWLADVICFVFQDYVYGCGN